MYKAGNCKLATLDHSVAIDIILLIVDLLERDSDGGVLAVGMLSTLVDQL